MTILCGKFGIFPGNLLASNEHKFQFDNRKYGLKKCILKIPANKIFMLHPAWPHDDEHRLHHHPDNGVHDDGNDDDDDDVGYGQHHFNDVDNQFDRYSISTDLRNGPEMQITSELIRFDR